MERAEGAPPAAGNGSVRRAPSTSPSARVSIWESVRASGLCGKEVEKADLRRQVVMPLYLRRAVAAAVAAKDEAAGMAAASAAEKEEEGPLVAPVVVFVNSKSGGRHGPDLKVRLHELISEEQVNDVTIRTTPVCAALPPRFRSPVLLSYCLCVSSLASLCRRSFWLIASGPRFQWNFTAIGAETHSLAGFPRLGEYSWYNGIF
jgi:hypothetical protein